jgi:hypothetical protein
MREQRAVLGSATVARKSSTIVFRVDSFDRLLVNATREAETETA